jgi:carboxynorspermidine decarboxylase
LTRNWLKWHPPAGTKGKVKKGNDIFGMKTPYYLIDEKKILKNLKIIGQIKAASGAKVVLALKCFSTWSVFDLMKPYLDGTTSSSLYEALLGHEKFGKEVHAYSVAYAPDEICALTGFADKIIFNSVAQLETYYERVKGHFLGLRVNPGMSYSNYDLADPARRYSRLGVVDARQIVPVLDKLSGIMVHFNCDNDNFDAFSRTLDLLAQKYGDILHRLSWMSLGGGLLFTRDDYPVENFSKALKGFGEQFDIQIYLEPGESVITKTATLVTSVLDIVHNEKDIAIVDASIEAHMLDLLIYRLQAQIETSDTGKHEYIIGGRSCLAGDVFGEYRSSTPLKIGDTIKIADAAGYTMVKKNWFNGLPMPSIVVGRLDGTMELVRKFDYNDFMHNLS